MTTYPDSSLPVASPSALPALEADFGGGESEDIVIKPTLNPLRLQWMTGRLSTTTLEIPVGWHIEAEVNPHLDEILASLGTKRYVVQHIAPGPNGETRQVPYWALNAGGRSCSLIVIAYGIKSAYEMTYNIQERYGIAYGWEVVRDRQGNAIMKKDSAVPKRRCRLQFRTFLHELAAHGFEEWLPVSLSGYIIDDMLTAFYDQFRVLAAYRKLRRQEAPYWGFAIPMVPGPARLVGTEPGEQTTIIPMVTTIPKRVEEIDENYLRHYRIARSLQERIRDGLLDRTWEWSIRRSREIEGLDTDDEHHSDTFSGSETATTTIDPSFAETPVHVVEAEPSIQPALPHVPVSSASHPGSGSTSLPQDANDPPITAVHVNWIKRACHEDAQTIAAWCRIFNVSDLSHLRASQFTELLNRMSTPPEQA